MTLPQNPSRLGSDTAPQTPPYSALAPRPSRLRRSGLPLHIISGYANGGLPTLPAYRRPIYRCAVEAGAVFLRIRGYVDMYSSTSTREANVCRPCTDLQWLMVTTLSLRQRLKAKAAVHNPLRCSVVLVFPWVFSFSFYPVFFSADLVFISFLSFRFR